MYFWQQAFYASEKMKKKVVEEAALMIKDTRDAQIALPPQKPTFCCEMFAVFIIIIY